MSIYINMSYRHLSIAVVGTKDKTKRKVFIMVFGIILGIVFAIACIVGVGWTIVAIEDDNAGGLCGGVIVTIIGALLFIAIPFSFHTVDTGEVAVVKHLGKAKEVRTAGTHFDFWMTESYVRYDAKVQNVDIVTSAYSSDAQTMDVTMTLQYQIMSDKAMDIAKEYGSLDILQNRIQSIATERAKSVLSAYKADEIIADRATMSPMVEDAIKNAIGDKYFVNVSTVVLTNIDFTEAFEKAVEDKMIAEQSKLKADYENEAKVAAAEAEAQVKLKAAQAEAEAKRLAAEGEANAIAIKSLEVARMLGLTVTEAEGVEMIKPNLTAQESQLIADYLKYMEYLATWDGKLPDVIADGSAVVVTP
jgi:regulator of protease activity HflC (stomatin/prohibitin superfamily)